MPRYLTRSDMLDLHISRGGLAIISLLMFGCALPTPLPVEPIPSSSLDDLCPGEIIRGEPRYPREALNAAQNGWVITEFDVRPDGTTTNIKVVASSPRGIFEDAALGAVQKTRYRAGFPDKRCRLEFKFQMKRP